MKTDFKNFIDGSSNILIALPKNPYFDQVASALSLFLALEKSKSVSILCSSPMTVEFNRLVGVDKISQELGNKNLIIKFQNYQPQNIERVAYDIESNEFRLSVIPKPGFTPPEKDQVALSYTGVSADTVILIGGGNESHFPILTQSDFLSARKAHIGLSSLNAENAEIYSFAKTSSSTSEVIFELIKELGIEINSDMASNLLSGLHEGSKNFSTSYVTANTFKVASELMEKGASYTPREVSKTYTARDFGQNMTPSTSAPVKEEPIKEQSPISQMENVDEEPEEANAPKSWLEPKIFKGTNN